MWPLEGAMVQSLCINWRTTWPVNNRTHCHIITSLSNQFPLIFCLKEWFIKFIQSGMSCQYNIVKIFQISNPGSNYRCALDSEGKLSIKSIMNDWHLISDNICTKINVLLDLFNGREGNISCDGFTGE